jgi:hypothetical protein
MGTSSHFYIADAASAADYPMAARGAAGERVRHDGITPLELSTLWSLIERTDWNVKMIHLFPLVGAIKLGEHVVHEIPPRVVERLAALTVDEIARVAQAWSTTLEMESRTDDVRVIVVGLVRLAGRARVTHRGLFLANRFKRSRVG